MICLELFAGKRSFGKVAEKMGHTVISSDYIQYGGIDIVSDILDFNPEDHPFLIPDFIWASPPCEKFSGKTNVKGGGNLYFQTIKSEKTNLVTDIFIREDFTTDKRLFGKEKQYKIAALLHIKYLIKTLQIIEYYKRLNPDLIWCIENPATGFMKHVIKDKAPYHNYCTYCPYGFEYMKPTNIFSNIKLNLKSCKKRPNNHKGEWCHIDGFSKRWDYKAQNIKMIPKTYNDRSLIPEKLIEDILIQTQKYFNLNVKL